MSAMHNADRYPNGVTKLGPLQTDSDWTDGTGARWRWDDWYGWRRLYQDGWKGSFQTVEGDGPFMAVRDV